MVIFRLVVNSTFCDILRLEIQNIAFPMFQKLSARVFIPSSGDLKLPSAPHMPANDQFIVLIPQVIRFITILTRYRTNLIHVENLHGKKSVL